MLGSQIKCWLSLSSPCSNSQGWPSLNWNKGAARIPPGSVLWLCDTASWPVAKGSARSGRWTQVPLCCGGSPGRSTGHCPGWRCCGPHGSLDTRLPLGPQAQRGRGSRALGCWEARGLQQAAAAPLSMFVLVAGRPHQRIWDTALLLSACSHVYTSRF